MVQDVVRGLGSRHGKPFLCDIGLLLHVVLPKRGTQTLRFQISNQNRSTLQAETDPEKRAIGFAFLAALGVVSLPDAVVPDAGSDLISSLLDLLAYEGDTIGATGLRAMGADVSRLTRACFLTARQIATTLLIQDEEIGPVEGKVEPDLVDQQASVELQGDVSLEQRDLDEVLSWTINRDYVRETVLRRLAPLELGVRFEDRGHGLLWLGEGLVDGAPRPVFLLERAAHLDALD
jgi:hypothetical protein